jgi:hypothetical protein
MAYIRYAATNWNNVENPTREHKERLPKPEPVYVLNPDGSKRVLTQTEYHKKGSKAH